MLVEQRFSSKQKMLCTAINKKESGYVYILSPKKEVAASFSKHLEDTVKSCTFLFILWLT